MSNAAFWDGPIAGVVKAMKASGNRPGVIVEWKAAVEAWANQSTSADAAAVKAWLPVWQTRPLYTAAELAPIFPALAVALGVTKIAGRMPPQWSANRLANAIDFAGLPSRHIGTFRFFAVERLHYWRDAPIEEWKKELFDALD